MFLNYVSCCLDEGCNLALSFHQRISNSIGQELPTCNMFMKSNECHQSLEENMSITIIRCDLDVATGDDKLHK